MLKKAKIGSGTGSVTTTVRPVEQGRKSTAEAICPDCGVPVATHKCRLCGATKSISDVSGNVIWMRNGRVVAAFRDARDAYIKMAIRYGIPETEWPEKFRNNRSQP